MINKIKSEILSFVKTKKINIFLLFLALAFIILLLTKLSKSYTNTFVFTINKIHVPEEEVILNDTSQVLEITLKTFGFNLLQYHFAKPEINIDFSKNIDKTDSAYVWNKNKAFATLHNQFNKNIELVNIVPDSLWFAYDVNAVKTVPVKLLSKISYSPGYNLTDAIEVTPDSVKIIGAKAILDTIDEIETDTVILNDVKQNIFKTTNLKFQKFDKDVKFSVKKVSFKAKVEKYTEGTLPVTVQIINVPIGIKLKYFPKVVNVSYYTSLANFNTITAQDFRVVCDYSKMVKGQTSLVPELEKKPETVKYFKIKQEFVEFIITE
ncbi:YbbR-like domain-containing protein [Lacinutrix sp. C3R15]|uniref:YbbR-like domain-containing protein n=1 Tax=Flavobacteriaceae TaxID=49546 RepID=UPI001C08DFC4|nr:MULTISPECIES: YbbR-like domain-containing protein [Flavobacteriaceae]MBU2940611.1 YbbR-like domain-containing protein [Lacinutrix sp. C3R15]MDO6623929.1 YbbR-like domain-containing protein [Oceanihabitans sp. 1_MG-2023]